MITTRCGLDCTGCSFIEECGCTGCIKSKGNPFHGSCEVAECCQKQGHVHCGDCREFPCELLQSYSYDKEHGDEGARIEKCRSWSSKKGESRYPWLYEYLQEYSGSEKDFKVEWQWIRYMVGGKMYAAVCKDDTGNDFILNLKAEPSDGAFLRSQYPDITPGYYCNKVHWNSVNLYGEVPDDILKDMIDKSYQLIFEKLTKKKQKEILDSQ